MKKNCEWCGVEFEIAQGRWATGKHAHRFCGHKCGGAWRRAHETDGIVRTCKYCGVVFRPKRISNQRAEYCSKKCSGKDLSAREARRSGLVRHNRERRLWAIERGFLLVFRRLARCSLCGNWSFTHRCSECRNRLQEEVEKQRIRVSECKNCGREFTISDGRGRGRNRNAFCGKRCQLKYHKWNREVRLRRGQTYAPSFTDEDIFIRDHWICMLCGKRVKKGMSVPHPLAPTLDHIRPLHLYGQHIESNVQCAHFICNSRKSGKFIGQLRLAVSY